MKESSFKIRDNQTPDMVELQKGMAGVPHVLTVYYPLRGTVEADLFYFKDWVRAKQAEAQAKRHIAKRHENLSLLFKQEGVEKNHC